MTELTRYEARALEELRDWRAAPPGTIARYLGRATQFVNRPTEWVMDHTVVGRVVQGIMEVALDAATWTIDEERVVASYRKKGIDVASFEDVLGQVPLEAKDRAAARLARNYRWTAGAEGAGAGASSLGGPFIATSVLVADVGVLTGVACRATAHHAAIYGFRVEAPAERALALSVLSGATSPTDAAKQAALADLARISSLVAKRKVWEELEKNALVKALREAAEKLGINLTKAKLGQVIAVIGILFGGGYNSWYMTRVCEWSFWTYREQHLNTRKDVASDMG